MRRGVWPVLVSIALVACAPGPAQTTDTTAPTDLERERDAWLDLGIGHYRIVYTVENLNGMGGSDTDGRFDVVVDDTTIAMCTVTGNPSRPGCGQSWVSTTLFDWVGSFDPGHTLVSYDEQWHIPSSISYDDPNTADEEYEIRLISFQPLD